MILEIDFLGVQKPVNFEKIAKKYAPLIVVH
jgi:hypothetical protein